jgi:phosphoserine phosphatase
MPFTHKLVVCRRDAQVLRRFLPASVSARLHDKIAGRNSAKISLNDNVFPDDDPFLSLEMDAREAAAVDGVKHALFDANVTVGLARIHAPAKTARQRVCFFDMDATVVAQESIVELARAVGKEAEVEVITRQAMAGATPFRDALEKRLAILKGMPESLLPVVEAAITINPGMEAFGKWAACAGVSCFIVSGGFMEFAGPLAQRLGFAGAFAHRLVFENGRFTGRIEGEVVDAAGKAAIVRRESVRLGVDADAVVAIGDGANDLEMMKWAGLAVGYQPKQVLFSALDAANFFGDHRFLIHLLGP